MNLHRNNLSRRTLLARGSALGLGAIVAGSPAHLLAEELAKLEVGYAGSIGSLMEGPVKSSVAQTLKLDIHGHGQGANALAQSIVGGDLRPDVFVPITAGPMLSVIHAGKAEIAIPVALTEVVIVYSPKSRFAPRFDAAAAAKGKGRGKGDWWQILQEPGLRFGRSNPAGDPGGRSILFAMMLAAKKYKQADLVEKVLGATINNEQIVTGKSVTARLLDGELDAGSAYKIQSGFSNLPYITLPKEINLSVESVHADNPDVSLSIDGVTYYPEPLVYYAAVLKGATNPKGAIAFTEWLKGDEAQAIFRRYNYDPPGEAPELHAQT